MGTPETTPETTALAAEHKPLRCGYCGGALTIHTETTGPAYLSYERPESIECDELACQATWEPNGEPRDLPNWIRWPSSYSAPAGAKEVEGS